MRQTLIRQTLQRVTSWLLLVTLLAASLAYWMVLTEQRQRTLTQLGQFVQARVDASAPLFTQADQATLALADVFIKHYQQTDTDRNAFNQRFERGAEGALRSRRALFDGRWLEGHHLQHVSAFLSTRAPALDQELRHRLRVTLDVLAQLGPGLIGPFANVHVSLPENALLMYAPGDPWGLNARSDLDMVNLSTIKATLRAHNPDGLPVWSPLYRDTTAGQWVITYQRPIAIDGTHLITPSIDIQLNQLIDAMLSNPRDHGWNMIINNTGEVIAHPALAQLLNDRRGAVASQDFSLPGMEDVIERTSAATQSPGTAAILIDSHQGEFFAWAQPMAGPPWWFVSAVPKSEIVGEANRIALGVLAFGLLLLVLSVVSIAMVLRRRVAQPIGQLDLASQRIAGGDYASVADGALALPEPNNEISHLSTAFRTMAERIRDHERLLRNEVAARTQDLANANHELEDANHRLARLSQRDGLTDLLNRRRFDQDLERAVESARHQQLPFSLMMIDIDHFKHFNDHFGHQAGDDALQQIARSLAERMRGEDQVYRYGGEELVVLLHAVSALDAEDVGERLLVGIRALGLALPATQHGVVTASAGMAHWQGDDDDGASLLGRADRALYRAKSQGRNRLLVAT